MTHVHRTEYKGKPIVIWVTKVGKKHWDWSVKADEFPLRRNNDSTAPTKEAAIEEALSWAKSAIDGK